MDAASLATAEERILDEDIRAEVGRSARALAETMSWSRLTEVTRDMYQRAISLQHSGDDASGPSMVTIWAGYTSYHVARVAALQARGYQVTCLSYCTSHANYPSFLEPPAPHSVINNCEFDDVRSVPSFMRTLRLLIHLGPTIVLSCGWERPETLAAVIFKHWPSRRRRQVILMVENQRSDRQRRTWVEWVKGQYLHAFDAFVVGGNTHQEYLEALGLNRARISQGYDCVGNDEIVALAIRARKLARPPIPQMYFLTVARLTPKKNIGSLLIAYKRYVEVIGNSNGPWALVICGGGPLAQDLRDFARRLGIDRSVTFAGHIDDQSELIRFYVSAQAFVLASSHSEQWGLVVNEAMAAGLPVLVSQQCGCSAHLVEEGVNGFTFDGGSPDELAERMVWLHEHTEDLDAMGRASSQIVKLYSPDGFAIGVDRVVRTPPTATIG